jgi:transcriptional regulator with PAS, ATPase and Fis domain
MQAKLLRVIEERAFTRVGGETIYKTDARILCATNAKLVAAVADGRFRSDLYYRINVISVEIPPLRDRPDDILPLAERYRREFSEAFARDVNGFTPAAEQRMLGYRWPGNIRELRNRVERAVVLSRSAKIGMDLLFPLEGTEPSRGPLPTLAEIRDRAERHHIRTVLTGAGGRIDETAKLLRVSRSTLFEKIRKLDIRSET